MIKALLTVFIAVAIEGISYANQRNVAVLEKQLLQASDTSKVNLLLELSDLYLRKDSHKADSIALLALDEANDNAFLNGKIRAIISLGNINSFLGNTSLGELYCKQALHLSDSANNDALLSESYNLQYLLYYRSGNYDSAFIAADKSLDLATKSNHKKMLARGNQNLGILNSIRGFHAKAIEHFLLSEKYYREQGDEFALAMVLGNLGVTFEEAGNYQKALEYMHLELSIGQDLNDNFLIGSALADIGAVYSQMNLPDSSIGYYKRSLAIAQDANNYDLIILNLENIGSYYSNKGEYNVATSYLMSAYKMALDKGFEYQNVYITGHLAQNYLEEGKNDSALIFANEQLKLALNYEFLYDQKLAFNNLANVYAAKEQFKEAYSALQKLILIDDSLFAKEKMQQIEMLREQYETAQKEEEIENLLAKNETARYRNISYAGAAISFFILGALLYYIQRFRIKRNRLLLEKEKELDRIKSRFFANISHEFRTPLTLILGPIDDLIHKIEQTDIRRKLQVMQRNATRLLALVNQLLELSKIESGMLKLDMTTSDIIAITKGIAMSFHSVAEQKNICLTMDVQPGKLYMSYDRQKWETILTNLLSNAFKFTPGNGKIVLSSRLSELSDRQVIRFTLSDNGPGIAKDQLRHVFNRFYQAETNEVLHQEGSGIGLALTKELVELHKGTISAQSQPGNGSSFTIELPVNTNAKSGSLEDVKKTELVDAVHTEEEAYSIEGAIGSAANQSLILLIEDHADVSNYIKEILSDTYNVYCAKDGEEGIMAGLEMIPDLIISDVMMPKKDGLEVCKTLKENEKTSHIPIILLTAKSDSKDKIAGLLTEADDYITKPFVPKELLARIKNLIESRRKLLEKYKQNRILKAKDVTTNSIDEKFLNKLIELVELNIGDEKFGVEQLGREIGMSRSQLHRKLTALLDQGPNQFIRSFRLQRAHQLLSQKATTAAEVSYQVGFSSPSYFTRCFHEHFGYTPTEIKTT